MTKKELEKQNQEYENALKQIGDNIPQGVACMLFVRGMASAGHPFAQKIIAMYAKEDDVPDVSFQENGFVYKVTMEKAQGE